MKKKALVIGGKESTLAFICDSCGSSGVFHDEFGNYVCHSCGLCFDDPVINPSLAPLNKTREGTLIVQHSTKFGEGTLIGTKKERSSRMFHRLSRLQNICTTTPKDSAYIYFGQLKAEFEISIEINLFLNEFGKIFHKMPACTKARNIPKFCATVFIILCKKYGQDFEIRKVLNFAQMTLKEFYAIRRPIHLCQPNADRLSVKDLMRFSLKLISREIDHYQLGFEVFLFAKHLIQHHRHFLGEKVRIIAGSALIIALDYLKHPIKLSAFQISKDFGVSASTVYTRKNKFPYHRIDWIPQSSVPRVYPQLHHAKTNWIGNNRQIAKVLPTQVSLNHVSPHMEINNFLPS